MVIRQAAERSDADKPDSLRLSVEIYNRVLEDLLYFKLNTKVP